MHNFLLFYSGNSLIAHSGGERKVKKVVKEKKKKK